MSKKITNPKEGVPLPGENYSSVARLMAAAKEYIKEHGIYTLELHQAVRLPNIVTGNPITIIRVPGGWLYDSTFVPFSNEFM